MKIVNKNNFNRLNNTILILFGLYLTMSIVSNTFDPDFGWHLRFGQDAWNNNFQYTDSYTWAHQDQSWINHEWGGDMVFWLLYDKLGYFSLVFFISLALWLAFLFAPKIFTKKLTLASILISVLTLLSIKFIIIMRLSMLGPLFFVWLWWSLEKMPDKKTYRLWPIILWLWSFFHGSWILGFIVINIYLVGEIITMSLHSLRSTETTVELSRHFRLLAMTKQKTWNWDLVKKTIIWQLISALVITINPYGWKIWIEVIKYFTSNFYKTRVNEWLPSYAYPVHWWPLIIVAIAMVIIYLGRKNKLMNWPRLLLFVAFFISAMQYVRNNVFLMLVCTPILVIFLKQIKWPVKKPKLIGYVMICIVLITVIIYTKPTIRYNNDIWKDRLLIAWHSFPVEAVEFLKKQTVNQSGVRLFNRLYWGGYLNWTLPNALVYMDGRGTVTWTDKDGQLLLKKYFAILSQADQLAELEQNQVQYIILDKNYPDYPAPKWSDKILFSQSDLEKAMAVEQRQLEKDLFNNPNWELIYTDQLANIWHKKSSSQYKTPDGFSSRSL
ncbi:MAG: hypothetical protein ABIH87_01030 [bacterium]